MQFWIYSIYWLVTFGSAVCAGLSFVKAWDFWIWKKWHAIGCIFLALLFINIVLGEYYLFVHFAK
jgi:hypothetical protein